MRIKKEWLRYTPVNILLDTYDDYRQLEEMLYYVYCKDTEHANFATKLLRALHNCEKD